jgi:hypothetical protein
MVVGLRVHKRERGRGVGCRKPENEPAWLGFGSTVSNGGVGRWWILVRLFIRSYHGRGAARSQTRAGERVGCQKPENEPAWLGFGSAMSNGDV